MEEHTPHSLPNRSTSSEISQAAMRDNEPNDGTTSNSDPAGRSASKVSSIAESVLHGYQKRDPNSIKLERIAGWIVWLVLTGIGVVAWLIAYASSLVPLGLGILLGVIIVLSVCLAWLAHVFPRWQYEAAGWLLTDKGLTVRSGVFWRKAITIPRSRVQHADVHQGPLMRNFEVANLIIHTAGTENASVELSGLNRAVAERLRDALVEDREFNDAV